MQVIIDFICGMAEAIITVFSYLLETVVGLANVIKMLLYFVPKIPRYFRWMPAECLSLVTAIFGVVVIYKIIGREG
mgnify:CR=1 FL=1